MQEPRPPSVCPHVDFQCQLVAKVTQAHRPILPPHSSSSTNCNTCSGSDLITKCTWTDVRPGTQKLANARNVKLTDRPVCVDRSGSGALQPLIPSQESQDRSVVKLQLHAKERPFLSFSSKNVMAIVALNFLQYLVLSSRKMGRVI